MFWASSTVNVKLQKQHFCLSTYTEGNDIGKNDHLLKGVCAYVYRSTSIHVQQGEAVGHLERSLLFFGEGERGGKKKKSEGID